MRMSQPFSRVKLNGNEQIGVSKLSPPPPTPTLAHSKRSRERKQAMDLAMGAMGTLLPKLGDLLSGEYKMQTSVKKDVESFTAELRSMRAALERVAEVPRELLDPEVKLWAGDVRELSYDMEDVVDSLLVRVKGPEPDADTDGFFKELMRKISNMGGLFTQGKARRQIATAVREIKEQVQEVATRHKRYKVDGIFANLDAATRTTFSIDPRLVAMYEDQQRIVGIGNARDELIGKLRLDDDVSEQPKIFSIVGFGGLGKTTLAKAVYDKLKSGFDCAAFVPVSRNPDLKKVLNKILFEVDEKKCKSLSGMMLDEMQLINELKKSLGTKSYFIVIDDIWDINAWKIIQVAFMDSNRGSRIITTTRNIIVSKECCSYNDDMVYNMKPLSAGDSERLFYKRIFSRENICPPELEQVSRDILKKCGGVPLAIITLASHLAANRQIKPKSQWYDLLKSIGRGLTNDDTNLLEMKRILSISFYDLPSHLKTCLLYLSVFPEDFIIRKGRLIRRWIAEGFIQGDNLFELGERYFNELINRSMIQPIYIDGDGLYIDDGGMVESCCVHDMMLDLICDLASEQNFITILDATNGDAPFERKVRRISLQKSMTELTNTRLVTTSMSQVRSFTIFSPAINQMLPLSRFQLLRVLDLEDCYLGESHGVNLRCVGNLLHLRYLGLRNTELSKIPMEIGRLLFLQILDLKGVYVRELPMGVLRPRNLICMYLEYYTKLPVGFRILTSLEELTEVYLREDGDDLEALGYLTELRVLSFKCASSLSPMKFLILVESLRKLQKLQSLDINIVESMQGWIPPPHLRRLVWRELITKIPTWISPSSLPLLSHLKLSVYKAGFEHIQILGTLLALRYVHLNSYIISMATEDRERWVLSADAFPCARDCNFWFGVLVPSVFTRGAMPMVRTLRFGLLASDVLNADLDLSIRNLPSLLEVSIFLPDVEASSERFAEADAALRRAADDHPNCDLRLSIYDGKGRQHVAQTDQPMNKNLHPFRR